MSRTSYENAPDMDDNESYFKDEPDTEGFSNQGPAATGYARARALSGKPQLPPAVVAPTAGADGEVDPLDAFMAEINAEVSTQKGAATTVPSKKPKFQASAAWEDNLEDDPAASYLEAHAKEKARAAAEAARLRQAAAQNDDDDDDDKDGDRRNRPIEPLPSVDHSQIQYNLVEMDFYKPHPEIAALSGEEVQAMRGEMKISATGSNIACPVPSFALLSHVLGEELMEGIRRHGYDTPTAIQAQAVPVALGGRDIIGIAETGSGKTVAYLLPMLLHTAAQSKLEKDEGPISIVLCPTRELAVQIEQEVFKFNKHLGLGSVTLAGGLSKLEQFKQIKGKGSEIAICTPGRLIDMVKMKGCNLRRVSFIVIDEADRMLQMGFEYQVRSIVQAVRPSRQTLFFSATFPPKIEKLARDLLQQPCRITVGEAGQAASNVSQFTAVLANDSEKWAWLSKNTGQFLIQGQVLIFVKSIASAEELTQNFMDFLGREAVVLHGDMEQADRMKILKKFRKRKVDVLIATDIAARGLDIPTIRTVVSFDVAKDIEMHTHRIGRTGRAGASGEAHTLLTNSPADTKMAAYLVEHLEQANQNVSEELQGLAMKNGQYRSAKLSGRSFDGKKKKGEPSKTGTLSSFGLGFDGQAAKKETVQDLESRLNKQADAMVKVNRQIMAGGGPGSRTAPTIGKAAAGFVRQAVKEENVVLPKPAGLDSDSDDDLFAPGVTGAFGKAAPAKPPVTSTPAKTWDASWAGAKANQWQERSASGAVAQSSMNLPSVTLQNGAVPAGAFASASGSHPAGRQDQSWSHSSQWSGGSWSQASQQSGDSQGQGGQQGQSWSQAKQWSGGSQDQAGQPATGQDQSGSHGTSWCGASQGQGGVPTTGQDQSRSQVTQSSDDLDRLIDSAKSVGADPQGQGGSQSRSQDQSWPQQKEAERTRSPPRQSSRDLMGLAGSNGARRDRSAPRRGDRRNRSRSPQRGSRRDRSRSPQRGARRDRSLSPKRGSHRDRSRSPQRGSRRERSRSRDGSPLRGRDLHADRWS